MNEIDPQIETNDIMAEIMGIPSNQRVQFRLIQLVGNTKMRLVGVKIVRDLLDSYKRLWRSCLVGSSEECSISILKDLPYQFKRNLDTLYIMPVENKKEILKELEKLTKSWKPDEVKLIPKSEVKTLINVDCPILKIYWKIPTVKEIFTFSSQETKEKIIQAKIDLKNRHPWFGWLARYLRIKEKIDGSVSTICVNGRGDLFYKIEFIKSLEINEIKVILCHEILHLALQHPFRANKRNRVLYNLAADLKVNSMICKTKPLSDLELPKNAFTSLLFKNEGIDVFWLDPVIINNISQKTTDQIYYELKKELPFKLEIKPLSKENKRGEKGKEIDTNISKLPKNWEPLIKRMIEEVSLDKDDIKPAEVRKLSKEWWGRVIEANQQFKKDIPTGLRKELSILKRKK